MRKLAALLKKEILQSMKNKVNRAIIIVPPLVQIILFSYAANLDLTRIDFTVLDHDKTLSSRALAAEFTGSGIFRETRIADSESAIASLVSLRKIRMALVIPQNFERDMKSGRGAAVQILLDGRNSSSAGVALGYAQNVIAAHNLRSRGVSAPVSLQTRAWYNENFNMRWFLVPALLAIVALLDVMMLTSLSIAREREEGTFDQLLVAPYSPFQILLSKALANIMIGVFQLTMAFLIAVFWFKVPFRGSYVLLIMISLIFLASATGSGILISVFCRNLQQAMLGTFIVAVPFVTLSGFTAPVENMPEIFQRLTLVNPVRFAIAALQELFLENAGVGRMLYPAGMMGAIAVITFGTALYSLKKQIRG